MSEFEVKIQKIFIKPHLNADALELGNIGDPEGWQVVVKKGLYKTGDLVAYIPENAVVPEWVLKKYGFWNEEKDKGLLAGSKGDRVKMIKLRDEPSLGIVLPVTKNPNGEGFMLDVRYENDYMGISWVKEDENVAELLGVTKYEPQIPIHMSGEVFNAGQDVGVNYDIEDLKNYPHVLVEGEEVQMTSKLHGCVDKNTQILLPDFSCMPIYKIIENKIEKVLSFDISSNRYIEKRITGTSVRKNTTNKKWIKLMFNETPLILTEDHPVYSRDRGRYILANEINLGEDIESPLDK